MPPAKNLRIRKNVTFETILQILRKMQPNNSPLRLAKHDLYKATQKGT